MQEFGIQVKYFSIWRWVQRLGEMLEGKTFWKRERRALIADETKIKVQGVGFGFSPPETRRIAK